MPAPSIKSHVLTSVLLATMVLGVCTPGYSADSAPWVGQTLDGEKCVGKGMGFGPYDYLKRAQLPAELDVVERAHFTPEVERLEAGNTTEAIGDINYTITAWPNHHRALYSAMRYRMAAWEWPEDARVPPAECQLQRAIAFSPNDPVPYMLFGMLLHKAQKYDDALASYRVANRLRPDDVLTLYNMGLTLVELNEYEEAMQVAQKAYAAGIPTPGLKNKLIAAGQWPGSEKPAKATAAAPGDQAQKQSNEPAKTVSAKNVAQGDKAKPRDTTTAKAKPAPEPKNNNKDNTKAKQAPKPAANPAPKPESRPAPKPAAKNESKPAPKPAANNESKPAPKPESRPKDTTKPNANDQPKRKPATGTNDQSKKTGPSATDGKQGIETPEVAQ